MSTDPVVIVAAKRTPIGRFRHTFKKVPAPDLAAAVIRDLLPQAALDAVNQVIMGCVLSAGVGQAPARQAALAGGLSVDVPCATVNKMCASGLYALQLAYQHVLLHPKDAVIAGGMENMSRAPYLLPGARYGYALNNGEIADHLIVDGLLDAYQRDTLMSDVANDFSQNNAIDRVAQDAWARKSLERSQRAWEQGYFNSECVSIGIGDKQIDRDSCFEHFLADRIGDLSPLKKGGSVTAANASAIADGAACLCMMRQSIAEQRQLRVLARVCGFAQAAAEPKDFPGLPADAIQQLLARFEWPIDSVSCFEINEAFAVVAVSAIRQLGLDAERVNAWGGACALGHPIGATGARLVVTLIHRLQHGGGGKGVASLCLAGGEALAMGIEVEKERA